MIRYQKSALWISGVFFSLSIILSGCCSRRDIMLNINEKKGSDIFISHEVKTPPSNSSLAEMEKEAETVMNEALRILKRGKIIFYLSSKVNENSQAMEEWVSKTKGSQVELGLLLKEHPNIFCLTVSVKSHSFKQFNLMWVVLARENKCIVMASPDYSCASIYGVSSDSQEINELYVTIEDIPKYFSVAQAGSQGYKVIDDKKIINDTPIMKTIFEYYCPARLAGTDSKGTLINFDKRLNDKKRRRFSVTGIRTTTILNYDGANDNISQSDCPINIYGKPYWNCSSIVLSTQ